MQSPDDAQAVPHMQGGADGGGGGGSGGGGGVDNAAGAGSSERIAALEAQVASLTQQGNDKQVAFEVSETQLIEQRTKNGVLMKKVVDMTMELTQTGDELKVKSAALSGSLTNATDLREKLEKSTTDLTASRARVTELVAANQEVDDELKRERLDQVAMETKINELQKKLDHAEYMQRVKEDQLMKARGDLTYANEEKRYRPTYRPAPSLDSPPRDPTNPPPRRPAGAPSLDPLPYCPVTPPLPPPPHPIRYKDSDIGDLKRQLAELTLECQFRTDEKNKLEARDVQVRHGQNVIFYRHVSVS